ncbi:class I SAM-dependent methyltransferase [Dactylosporangium roseum]|uniref:class I SAM-dependent methyltransferase n=1 Tax=Dactylosporangium roseum TaxID=47989 RepID=UPI0021B2A6C5|nr:class I SAM-dependent methyltransferase [Dactylosporangium roseum]
MSIDEAVLALDERSQLDFVLALRQRWADTVYPALREQYVRAAGGASGESLEEATRIVHTLPLYPWFSWMERAQQKILWRTAGDAALRREQKLRALFAEPPAEPTGELVLHPGLELPDWYTGVDIHLQPGGVWGDDLSAYVYELGARIVMLRDNDDYRFHRLFVETALPDTAERVVDIGCGFGKSTRPLVDRYPGAEVIGVDLSAPVLRLAHLEAERLGKKIRFLQRDGADTGLESGSMDLVTGTMVLHELPSDVIVRAIAEAARLLRPGGSLRFLEFWPTGEPFRDVTVYEHAERNNEPYFRDLFATDVLSACAEHGLVGARWVRFDERAKGLLPDGYEPRNEWHFPWTVLCAEKAG